MVYFELWSSKEDRFTSATQHGLSFQHARNLPATFISIEAVIFDMVILFLCVGVTSFQP